MKIVIIGASIAGISTIKQLRKLGYQDEIILISKDTKIYSRCIMHHYLQGQKSVEELNFAGMDFVKEHDVQWLKSVIVNKIDPNNNKIYLDNGYMVTYDKLCIASGAHTFLPPIDGLKESKNVIGFRNLEDVDRIINKLSNIQNVLIMGGGLVGIDVIEAFINKNINLYLIETGEHLLPIQLDHHSAKTYQDILEKLHVHQYYNVGVKKIIDEQNKSIVILQDNTIIPVDLIINCAGVRANIDFLKETHIECDNYGLIVDRYGQTNIDNIYGAGDVTGHDMVWTKAMQEGINVAFKMLNIDNYYEDFFDGIASMYFLGISTTSIGDINKYNKDYNEDIILSNNSYEKKVYLGDKLVGKINQEFIHDDFIKV